MKWSLMFKEKMKAAIILVILMLSIIVSNIIEKRIEEKNIQTISSVFQDRLTPSVDLFQMRDLNDQRISLINQNINISTFKDDFLRINQDFNQLLEKYKSTYLVDEEKVILLSLNKNLNYFQSEIDKNLVQNIIVVNALKAVNTDLNQLSKIQEKVGKELLSNYKNESFWSQFLNTFQVILAIIMGLIILKMVSTSTLINKSDLFKGTHHLN
jgi:uncharacterized protein YejL (UPF0352 family)